MNENENDNQFDRMLKPIMDAVEALQERIDRLESIEQKNTEILDMLSKHVQNQIGTNKGFMTLLDLRKDLGVEMDKSMQTVSMLSKRVADLESKSKEATK